jgi:curved DNA-binding protein CbpA
LGLRSDASSVEIKSAFRRLAKIYHPDKNPGGKERFTLILKAYEVLSDPVLKSTYDYRLQNGLRSQHNVKKNPATKTWSFDEKEMKRRQYYNDHIKQYTKSNAHFAEPVEKKSYSEYKYILFAIPVAVALFLMIMNLATDPPHLLKRKQPVKVEESANVADLKNGDAPYTDFFGGSKYDSTDNRRLTVKNNSGKDVIICVFSTSGFWRSSFIEGNKSFEIDRLSKKSMRVFYCSGSAFSQGFPDRRGGEKGTFTKDQHYYKSETTIKLNPVFELTLQAGANANFKEITEEEFFSKASIHS